MCREPKLAFHAYLSSRVNNQVFKFRFPDAPPFSFVEYKFEIDAPAQFISLMLMAHPSQCRDFTDATEHHYSGGGIRVNRARDMFLKVFVRAGASPFSLRVYVTSWTSGNPDEQPSSDYKKTEYTLGWTASKPPS